MNALAQALVIAVAQIERFESDEDAVVSALEEIASILQSSSATEQKAFKTAADDLGQPDLPERLGL